MTDPSPAAEAAAEAAASAVEHVESTEQAAESAVDAHIAAAEATAHAEEASEIAGSAHAVASEAAQNAAEASVTAEQTAEATAATAFVAETAFAELRSHHEGLRERIEALERHRDSQAKPEPEVVTVPVTDSPEAKSESGGESSERTIERKRRHKFGR